MTRIIGRGGASSAQSLLPREWRSRAPGPGSEPASARAAQLLLQARQQARTLVQDAEQAAHAAVEDQRRLGWQQGYGEGWQQALQENAGTAQRLALVVAAVTADYEASARNLDEQLVSLSLMLARLIVQHEVAIAPDTVLRVARAALREVSIAQAVALRVHEDDAALLQARISSLGLPDTVRVAVVVDPAVAAGGCMVESGAGRVDATIDTQLARLERLLHEQLDAASA